MHRLRALVFVLIVLGSTATAQPASVADGVKTRGTVRCGSVERPGLAQQDGKGRWRGLEVDVCRAVAAAVLGSPDKFSYRTYETPKEFDAVREQQDDVFFLSGMEIRDQKLAGVLVPGPTVFIESHGVMVPATSRVRHVAELQGQGVCFVIGASSERSLSNYLEKTRKPWLRHPFSEEGEMTDAYNAQKCHAVAGEITTLASYRLNPGVNRLESRILPEPTTSFPLIAATGTGDGKWALAVAWTVTALISGERPETKWYAGGAGAMPVDAPEAGLDKGWQRRVLTAVGHYGDIFERNLGKGSAFQLERGLNANHIDGGLLLGPFLD